jgi:eukaryotic-like serine/threonine-protein kinase
MNRPDPVEEAIFQGAQQLGGPEQRAAYLDEACAGNPKLRRRIERLLEAGDQAKRFFEAQGPGPVATVALDPGPVRERFGDRIGRYKLLERIGEGGCGVVYVAEQEEPVRRRVALKVIKLGMDTRQVIGRFEE